MKTAKALGLTIPETLSQYFCPVPQIILALTRFLQAHNASDKFSGGARATPGFALVS
jgi:hypothetical protein